MVFKKLASFLVILGYITIVEPILRLLPIKLFLVETRGKISEVFDSHPHNFI